MEFKLNFDDRENVLLRGVYLTWNECKLQVLDEIANRVELDTTALARVPTNVGRGNELQAMSIRYGYKVD